MRRLIGSIIAAGLIAQAFVPIPAFSGEPNRYAEGIHAEMAGQYVLAIDRYTLSAKTGLSDAKLALGRLYRDVYGDADNSFKWFKQAAEQGNIFAQFELGVLYQQGSAAVIPDRDQATKWLTTAANRGHSQAAYALFEMATEDTEALRRLQQAANHGVVDAMQRLGTAYRYGEFGLNVDLTKSQEWLERAILAQE